MAGTVRLSRSVPWSRDYRSTMRPRPCRNRCRGTRHTCALPRNHLGPHMARGIFGRIVATWDLSIGAQEAQVALGQQERSKDGHHVGAPAESTRTVTRRRRSIDQILFLGFLLAFIAFAIQWALALG